MQKYTNGLIKVQMPLLREGENVYPLELTSWIAWDNMRWVEFNLLFLFLFTSFREMRVKCELKQIWDERKLELHLSAE